MAGVAAGFGALVGALDRAAPAVDVPWIVLAAMFVPTAAFVVPLPYGRASHAVSLDHSPLFIGVHATSPNTRIPTPTGGASFGLHLRGLLDATTCDPLAAPAPA